MKLSTKPVCPIPASSEVWERHFGIVYVKEKRKRRDKDEKWLCVLANRIAINYGEHHAARRLRKIARRLEGSVK